MVHTYAPYIMGHAIRFTRYDSFKSPDKDKKVLFEENEMSEKKSTGENDRDQESQERSPTLVAPTRSLIRRLPLRARLTDKHQFIGNVHGCISSEGPNLQIFNMMWSISYG